jgi:undecaprenyl-phosphate galactose phosphotransferase
VYDIDLSTRIASRLPETKDLFVTVASNESGTTLFGGAESVMGSQNPSSPLMAKLVKAQYGYYSNTGSTGYFGGNRTYTSSNGPTITTSGNPSNFIVGNGKNFVYRVTTRDLLHELSLNQNDGYHVSAYCGPKKYLPAHTDIAYYPNVERALNIIKPLHITAIIHTDLYEDNSKNDAVLSAAQVNHIDYNFIPGQAEFYAGKNTIDVFLGYPMISVSQTPLIGWGEIAKRIFDVIITTALLLILSPLLIIIIIFQKIFNPGPVFYKSQRLSHYSDSFTLYKFRSMNQQYGKKDAADEFRDMGREDLAKEYETHRKVKKDPRITRFGQLLRTTSLDELPQFFNVVKGDLSLVGPRPILPQEMKLVRKASLLHSVKSGVTGLWQVSGRNNLDFHKRIELETYYAQNWSFWLDIKILLKTIWVVLTKHGAK